MAGHKHGLALRNAEFPRLSEELSNHIQNTVDDWIDNVEESCILWMGAAGLEPKSMHRIDTNDPLLPWHIKLVAELWINISSVRTWRRAAAETDERAYWELAMLHVFTAMLKEAEIREKVHWKSKHNTKLATEAKRSQVTARHSRLKQLIKNENLSAENINGSRKIRGRLRDDYQEEFNVLDKTFSEDLKALGYNPR